MKRLQQAWLAGSLALACGAVSPVSVRPVEPGVPTDSLGLVFPALDAGCRVLAFAAAGQVYLHPLGTGRFELVSVDGHGRAGDRPSGLPALGASARIVAFNSAARLVPGRRSRNDQVYVRDRGAGETQCVSVSSQDALANDANLGLNTGLAVSADGGSVAFSSHATNLVAGDRNGSIDVFVHDLRAGTTERASLRSSGQEARGDSAYPSLSRDGSLVAFSSEAPLSEADANAVRDVFLRDRRRDTTRRISVSVRGGDADGPSDLPAISADGRWVAFASDASDLVLDDRNGSRDVFLYDREQSRLERISPPEAGSSDFPRISAEGARVAFVHRAASRPEGKTPVQQVVVFDRAAGQSRIVSVDPAGAPGNDDSGGWGLAISDDGRCVAFTSFASNLSESPTSLFVAELPR